MENILTLTPKLSGAAQVLLSINTGQASLWPTQLILQVWTTAKFDFNVTQHQWVIPLTEREDGTLCGTSGDLNVEIGLDCRAIITCQSVTVRLPPFSTTYHGGKPVKSPLRGVSRFSVNPKREPWTTGPLA